MNSACLARLPFRYCIAGTTADLIFPPEMLLLVKSASLVIGPLIQRKCGLPTMAKKRASTKTAGKKSKCPITKRQFKKAKPLALQFGNSLGVAQPREFHSGSLGWYFGKKIVVDVDGVPCRCQVTCSIVVIGSYPAYNDTSFDE